MATSSPSKRRRRGTIAWLPSGSARVKVYAGIDQLTGKEIYLRETIRARSTKRETEREAEKVITRLVNQVDERRSPKTEATVNELLDRWLDVVDIEKTTRTGYVGKIEKHIRPTIGRLQVGRLRAETIESLYAQLRRCRDHCKGRKYVQHRTEGEHVCDEHSARRKCAKEISGDPEACFGEGGGSAFARTPRSSRRPTSERPWRWQLAERPPRLAHPRGSCGPPQPQLRGSALLTSHGWRWERRALYVHGHAYRSRDVFILPLPDQAALRRRAAPCLTPQALAWGVRPPVGPRAAATGAALLRTPDRRRSRCTPGEQVRVGSTCGSRYRP